MVSYTFVAFSKKRKEKTFFAMKNNKDEIRLLVCLPPIQSAAVILKGPFGLSLLLLKTENTVAK